MLPSLVACFLPCARHTLRPQRESSQGFCTRRPRQRPNVIAYLRQRYARTWILRADVHMCLTFSVGSLTTKHSTLNDSCLYLQALERRACVAILLTPMALQSLAPNSPSPRWHLGASLFSSKQQPEVSCSSWAASSGSSSPQPPAPSSCLVAWWLSGSALSG